MTHDRWFLDAVCTATWEVADGAMHQYEGGYAAYVLARAERDRQAAARDERRQQLMRKELAWLRRGPPARTSKPKFRIEAANALIADEPEPRDRAELLRFATRAPGRQGARRRRRVGRVRRPAGAARRDLAAGARRPRRARRRQRLGQDDADEAAGRRAGADAGHVERGATVRLAHLSQDTAEIPGHLRVLESLEAVGGARRSADGAEITAALLCDRFGFRGDKARTLVRDLSGGERRRLQLMRLLMDEPNVLLLDEPTNDLDIDTLTALEDLLDALAGDARRRQPRPLLRRAGLRRRPRADERRRLATCPAASSSTCVARRGGGGRRCPAVQARCAVRDGRAKPAAARSGARARSSRASSARSRSSTRARPSCTTRWPPRRPTTRACASCRPSSRARRRARRARGRLARGGGSTRKREQPAAARGGRRPAKELFGRAAANARGAGLLAGAVFYAARRA